MSLILQDIEKYKKMVDEFKKEDAATLSNTVAYIRNMSDSDIADFLDFLGKFLRTIRCNNNMSLRSFCLKHDISSVVISEIERGLRLPNIDILDIYLRDDLKEKSIGGKDDAGKTSGDEKTD